MIATILIIFLYRKYFIYKCNDPWTTPMYCREEKLQFHILNHAYSLFKPICSLPFNKIFSFNHKKLWWILVILKFILDLLFKWDKILFLIYLENYFWVFLLLMPNHSGLVNQFWSMEINWCLNHKAPSKEQEQTLWVFIIN